MSSCDLPQIPWHNEIDAIPLTNPHARVEIDHCRRTGGVVAEAVVLGAVLDQPVRQHRDAGVVADDGEGVVAFTQDQIEDRVRARVIERGFEINGGVAAQGSEEDLGGFGGSCSVRDEQSIGHVVHPAQPVANRGRGFAAAFGQAAFVVVHQGIVPTGFCMADKDEAFGHRNEFIWKAACSGNRLP